MDPSNVHPDVLGEALGHSSQRLAQLASLVTGGAMLEARRRAQRNAAETVRKQRELKALQDQERAAYQMARAGWAPVHDSRWLAQADLLQAFRAWSAATAYADADPSAASSARRCEERLRVLHPYGMAWYDRLRSEGAGAFDAMRQALPLFDRAPHPRPGRHAGERRVLPPSAGPDCTLPDDGPHDDSLRPGPDGDGLQVERRGFQIVRELQARALAERGYALSRDELVTTLGATTTLPSDIIGRLAHADGEDRIAAGAERARAGHLDSAAAAVSPARRDGVRGDQPTAASHSELKADTARTRASGDSAAVHLAAESFPYSITDAITAAAGTRHRSATRGMTNPNTHRPGRSV
jgi:hypothetical protein